MIECLEYSSLEDSTQPMKMYRTPRQKHYFSPYEDNQGTIVAIAGDGFVVIGSDSRLSSGYTIFSRNQSKLFRLTPKAILGSCGCWCDVLCLTSTLDARLKLYKSDHGKEMSTPAVSHLLTAMLYNQRFFPYYAYNILGGIGEDGQGCIYSYDSVGSKGQHLYHTAGSSAHLLQPLLDNQIGGKNLVDVTEPPKLPLEKCVSIVKDVFISAAERDIHTGDGIIMNIITRDGIIEDFFALRKD